MIAHAHSAYNPGGPTADDLRIALNRAHKLVDWMMGYVGNMAPMSYHDCYCDLNEHCLFMERYGVRAKR